MTTTPSEPITGNEDFAEAYSLTTGLKQRVPRAWLDDPVLGRDLHRTPSQRELDGDLPARPTQDSTVEEIDEYADAAGIDLPSDANKTEKLSTVEGVFSYADVQGGLVEIVPDPPLADPLDPATVARGAAPDVPESAPTEAAPVDEEPLSDPAAVPAAELKGAALEEALKARGLSSTGTADEKRAAVAEHDAASDPSGDDQNGAVDTTTQDGTTTSTDGTESPDETPTGDEEN